MNKQHQTFARNIRRRWASQRGFSLIAVIVAAGLLGIVAVAFNQVQRNAFQGLKGSDTKLELTIIRKRVLDNISCTQTLGIQPTTNLPVACPAQTVVMRRENGAALFPSNRVGQWAVQARCSQGGLTVRVNRKGKDPLTKKDYKDLTYQGVKISQDLFGGTYPVCQKYLDPARRTPGMSPGRKCITFKDLVARNDLGANNNVYKGKNFTCPATHPLAVSATTEPACNALGWFSAFTSPVGGDYNRGVSCNMIFIEDRRDITQEEMQATIKACNAPPVDLSNGPPHQRGFCNYTCCAL